MSERRTIGVFDSGLGGLTVLRALLASMPTGVDFVYLGDTARVPYGSKSSATVSRYAEEAYDFLATQGCETIVLACNSASANGLDTLIAKQGEINVVGVIEPVVRTAIDAVTDGTIGVVCTRSTLHSGVYESLITQLRPDTPVETVACPLLVPLVEDGWHNGNSLGLAQDQQSEVVTMIAKHYISSFRAIPEILILGCTHYPMLRTVFERLLPETVIVDSAVPTASTVAMITQPTNLAASSVRYYATDVGSNFLSQASAFLGQKISEVHPVRLDQ